jgi:nuclease S1
MIARGVLGALLVWVSAAQNASAWGEPGHRMACRIAWDQLRETPRAEVKAILGITGEGEFAEACAWAERYLAEHPETAPRHEIVVPKGAREIDMARDCPPTEGCALSEITRTLEILKSGAPREDRATALKFLAHLVADVHQPLRVAFAEDRGGAAIAATFLGRPTTLRAIWETEMLASDPDALEELAKTYHLYTPLDRLYIEWLADRPEQWATESLWIMRTPATGYVGNPGGLDFDETYVKQNLPVALDRIARAGMRLGHILNEALRAPVPE